MQRPWLHFTLCSVFLIHMSGCRDRTQVLLKSPCKIPSRQLNLNSPMASTYMTNAVMIIDRPADTPPQIQISKPLSASDSPQTATNTEGALIERQAPAPLAEGGVEQNNVGTNVSESGKQVLENSIQTTVALQTKITYLDDSKGNSICTGVVVGNNLVLTAAHCFVNSEKSKVKSYGGYVITSVNLNQLNGKSIYAIDKVALYPDWNGTFHDVALVTTTSALPGTLKILPVIKSLEELSADKTLHLIGYGNTGDGRSDSGVMRRSESAIHSEINKQNYSGISILNQIRVKDIGGKPSQACSGDSGGPAFAKSSGKLLGIVSGMHSFVQSDMTCNGGDANYTFIQPYIEWIASVSGQNLNNIDKPVNLQPEPLFKFKPELMIQPTGFVMNVHKVTMNTPEPQSADSRGSAPSDCAE